MAIDDNTSYELTGAQVKDLANKIKAKAADNIFVGATSAIPGSKGLVPQPQAGDDTKFLSGDGTWKTVSGGGASFTTLYADYFSGPICSDPGLYNDLSGDDISALIADGPVLLQLTGGLPTSRAMLVSGEEQAQQGIAFTCIAEGMIIKFVYQYSSSTSCNREFSTIQQSLTAGTNINISNNTISTTAAKVTFREWS
jgi:hypothetical protein